MNLTPESYVILGILIIGLTWGYAAGFNRCFKFFTTGLCGIAIAAVAAWFVGEILLDVEFFSKIVNESNASAEDALFIFGKIKLGTIIYFIILYIIFFIIKNIVVKCLLKCFSSKNDSVRFINKILGAIFLFALFFAVMVALAMLLSKNQDGSIFPGIIGLFKNSIFKGFFLNPPFST